MSGSGGSASAGRRHRHGRRVAGLAGGMCALAVALAGCQSVNAADRADAGAAASPQGDGPGPVLLAVPVEVRQLLHEYPCTTAGTPTTPALSAGGMAPADQPPMASSMHDLDGADCFQLTQPLLTLQRLDSIGTSNTTASGDWVIDLGLTRSDAVSLAGLTSGHTGQQLAIVVRGTVLATPTVDGPSDDIQISGDFSQDDAQRLMRQITG